MSFIDNSLSQCWFVKFSHRAVAMNRSAGHSRLQEQSADVLDRGEDSSDTDTAGRRDLGNARHSARASTTRALSVTWQSQGRTGNLVVTTVTVALTNEESGQVYNHCRRAHGGCSLFWWLALQLDRALRSVLLQLGTDTHVVQTTDFAMILVVLVLVWMRKQFW